MSDETDRPDDLHAKPLLPSQEQCAEWIADAWKAGALRQLDKLVRAARNSGDTN